jgi:hypothetical protein
MIWNGKRTGSNEIKNKRLSEIGQGLIVVSTRMNYFDGLLKRIPGGSMDDQVAKDSCVNANLFCWGLPFEVDANAIRADGVGKVGEGVTFQALERREDHEISG